MRRDGVDFSASRLISGDLQAGVNAPTDWITEDVTGDPVKEQARPLRQHLHDPDGPGVVPRLGVDEDPSDQVVRYVLLVACRLDDPVREAEVTRISRANRASRSRWLFCWVRHVMCLKVDLPFI